MTSRISSFKIALDDLKHRLWMIALSCLGSFLALPIAFLMMNDQYLRSYSNSLDYHKMNATAPVQNLSNYYIHFFQSHGLVFCGFILFFGALIVGILGFRHLFSRKMADVVHSLPISRDRHFVILYLNGFLIWVVPFLVNLLLTLICMYVQLNTQGCANEFGLLYPSCGRMLLVCTLCFLIIYNLAVLCVMLCGNVFNTLCLTVISGVLVCTVIIVHHLLCGTFYEMFLALPITMDQYSWTSPFINIAYQLYSKPTAFSMVPTLLITLVCLAGAFLLHHFRSSELAEHGLQNRPVQHILRVIVSIVSGLFCSVATLIFVSADSVGWMFFGAILGSSLVFVILNIIFHMDFHAVTADKIELAGTVLLTCLILLGYKLDITHFETRLPAKNSVASVEFTFTDLPVKEGDLQMDGDQLDALYALLEEIIRDIRNNPSESSEYGYLTLRMHLKNGLTFSRYYCVPATAYDELQTLVETDSFRTSYFPCSSGVMGTPDELTLDSFYSGYSQTIWDEQQRKEIMDAYAKDFNSHYSLKHFESMDDMINLFVTYGDHTYDLNIDSDYQNTITVLKKYYPEISLTPDSSNVSCIILQPGVDANNPRSVLYDVYGLNEDVDPAEVSLVDTYAEDYSEPYCEYMLTITNPEEIEELLPYLHFGYNDKYVDTGHLILSSGHFVECYVEAGAMPKEWVDRLVPTQIY